MQPNPLFCFLSDGDVFPRIFGRGVVDGGGSTEDCSSSLISTAMKLGRQMNVGGWVIRLGQRVFLPI